MTKFEVTPQLSTLIRTLRVQNKITSKDLAQQIGKSISYISRLENGGIKTIQEEELTAILSFITEDGDFFQEKLPSVIQALSAFMEPEQITSQIWLLHYDGFARPVPVPEEMVEELNRRMAEHAITSSMLAETVNDKSFIGTGKTTDSNMTEYSFHGHKSLFIHVSLDCQTIDDILEKRCGVSNYCTINNIVMAELRRELFDGAPLDLPEWEQIQAETDWFLDRYGIEALTVHQQLISPFHMMKQNQSMRAAFSQFNEENTRQILESFQHAAEHDLMKSSQAMETLKNNMEWDPAFMLQLLDIPFHRLGAVSFHCKSQLLKELEAAVEKYEKMPEHLRRFERYD